ncbi:MAG TPA: hypothetical protein VJR05_11500 [Acidimicrobiia bacterium]|nr:hypothetical protein [Acidimicrobiia bacterium]
MRRLVLFVAVFFLAISAPALAKMPPFDMEVEAEGETVHVTVRIVGDESLIHDFDSLDLTGLIAIFPADEVDEDGRPTLALGEAIEVPLNWVEPGTYLGSVDLEPGRWAVVPFPAVNNDDLRGGVEGWYPDTALIEIGSEVTRVWALAALGAVVATFAWRRRKSLPA